MTTYRTPSGAVLSEASVAAELVAQLPPAHPRQALYIFADGGCIYPKRKDPSKDVQTGPGGWGSALLLLEPNESPLLVPMSGAHPDTTNNQMELRAIIDALAVVGDLADDDTRKLPVYVISDSQYAIKGMTEWMPGWIKRCFADVKNVQYWKQLLVAQGHLKPHWCHCRGHRDPSKLKAQSWDRFTAVGNAYVDYLATQARTTMLESANKKPSR